MTRKSNMCIILWDSVVDAVFIENTMLGPNLSLMERFPRNETVYGQIAERLKLIEHAPAHVTLCLPRSEMMQRTLRYPAVVQANLDNMIQFEASRHVPLPEEDRSIAYAYALSDDEKQLVIDLQAARKSEISKHIESFSEVGIPIDATVSFSSLIASAVAAVPTLLVLSDESHLELCLYGRGLLQDNRIIRRTTPGFGESRIVAAAHQMVAQNKQWLGDEGIGRILLAGPVEIDGPVTDDLGMAFGLHTHWLAVPSEWEAVCIKQERDVLSEVLVAALVENPAKLNLIENRNRKVPLSKRTLMISILCILLAIELMTALLIRTFTPSMQRKKVAEQIAQMEQQTAPIKAMKDKNREMRKKLVSLDEMCKTRVNTMEILRILSETLPDDTYLASVIYERAQSLQIGGKSKDPNRLPALLQTLPFVETIEKSNIGPEKDDYYDFSLTLALRSGWNEKDDS